MFEQLRKAREDEGGFTLIELLIVIVILGILAAVVVFAVGGVTNKGNLAACQSDVKTIEVAAEAYYAQLGVGAPSLAAGLVPGFMHGSASIAGNTQTSTAGGYVVTFLPASPPSSGAGTVSSNLAGCP